MRELEVNLWNDIIRFLDKTIMLFSQNTINCLKNITVDIKHECDNKYNIQVRSRDNRMPTAEVLSIVKMVLIKYHPELDVKIFRESFNIRFGSSGRNASMMEELNRCLNSVMEMREKVMELGGDFHGYIKTHSK